MRRRLTVLFLLLAVLPASGCLGLCHLVVGDSRSAGQIAATGLIVLGLGGWAESELDDRQRAEEYAYYSLYIATGLIVYDIVHAPFARGRRHEGSAAHSVDAVCVLAREVRDYCGTIGHAHKLPHAAFDPRLPLVCGPGRRMQIAVFPSGACCAWRF